jgi:HAD superfamily hydrolase (TIGR01450 family)
VSEERGVVIDLDGVIWLVNEPIPGAADAIKRLRAAGSRVAFFTNNSFVTTKELLDKLARQAIDASDSEVLSSAKAAATLVAPSERVLVVGGPGIIEALEAKGAQAAHAEGDRARANFDVVVVGLDLDFDYRRLSQAQAALFGGARLIGTNGDATYPTPEGETPGGGSILAAVATAGGREPVIAGKPHPPAVALVRQLLGRVDLVVGDRPSTDGAFARALGAPFGHVHTGISSERTKTGEPAPDYEAEDLLALVEAWLSGGDGGK